VRPIGHGFAAFAVIVSLQAMTPACSSRSGAVPAQPGPAPHAQGITTPAEPTHEVVPDECALIPPGGESIATVGLTERIDPSHAPRPTNPGEQLVFRHLYETLVRVDCMGRVRPGLARSWQLEPRFRLADSNVRSWTVTLRENARFDDGTPVTAAAVHASWSQNARPGGSGQYVSRLINWVHEIDDRTLVIQLNDVRPDAPAALAHPDLAVARPVADSPWPLGTRSRSLETTGVARGSAVSEITVRRNVLPPLRFRIAPGDPRDLLDAGVDLLVTRDPATLRYAATLPDLQRVPVPWQRTYVYVSAGRWPSSPSLSEEARQALAADAVRGEARGAQGPFWFETAECQPAPIGGMSPHVPMPRIVYDAADPVARDLAERFVALAGASGQAATAFLDAVLPDRPRRAFERAAGLTGEALVKARGQGTDAGYIAFVDSRPFEPCNAKYTLLDAVPWARTILPLVDIRMQAVVRRGRSGLTTDYDGSVLIDDLNDPRSR
jgi:hypothetical protein